MSLNDVEVFHALNAEEVELPQDIWQICLDASILVTFVIESTKS